MSRNLKEPFGLSSRARNQHLHTSNGGLLFVIPDSSISYAETLFGNHPLSPAFFELCGKFHRENSSLEMEIDGRLLDKLEAMGFRKALATKALRSGNSSIEAAINWLVEHGNEDDDDGADSSETPMPEGLIDINIEAFGPFQISEQVKLRAQQLRSQARQKRAAEETKLEREREKERIQAGKELLEAKRMAEESERKRFISQRKADKEEERRAREKVRQKLHQDKLERRSMLGVPTHTNDDTSFPQITKNFKSVDSSVLPVKHAETKDRMRECLRSLKRQNKDDYVKAMNAFQTLFIYVKNVVKNPEEEKFRKIRISNPVFQDRVGKFEEGIEFLELCGFEIDEAGRFLLLRREKVDMGLLKTAWGELENALTNPFFGLFSTG